MPLWTIFLVILALYYRTFKSYFLIDDYTPRHKYPHPETESKDPKFYMTKPKWWVHPFIIAMHMVNTALIYILWGEVPAILFAVHPMSMWGAAWVTGNYYATTTYFLLISYFFLVTFPIWGILPAIIFFWCAMHSTFDAIPYPFILLCSGNIWGFIMLPIMVCFLRGKKFTEGLAGRKHINDGKIVDRSDFPINRLAFMTKVVARYTYETIIPMRVKLFDNWAEGIRDHEALYDHMHSWDRDFRASLALIAVVFTAGMFVHPVGTLWFFIFIALHSQFNVIGQTYAQRYIYIALPGLCAVAGVWLNPYPMITMAIVGFLSCRTWMGMKKWDNQEQLLLDEIQQCPERGDNFGLLGQFYFTIMPLEKYKGSMINMISYLIRKSVEDNPESWQMRMNLAAYLCKTGHVDEGLLETDKTIELLNKYSCDREKHLIEEMVAQRNNWVRINADLKLRYGTKLNKKHKRKKKESK